MSKRHFQRLAAVIAFEVEALRDGRAPRTARETTDYLARLALLRRLANGLADVCVAESGTFDRSRFLAACGLEG